MIKSESEDSDIDIKPLKRSLRSKRSSRPLIDDDEDDVLNSMLLDVPKLSYSPPPVKRQRVACPEPPDDCFDESLDFEATIKAEILHPTKQDNHDNHDNGDNHDNHDNHDDFHDFDDFDDDDDGIIGIPLDDNMKNNLEIYEIEESTYTRLYWYDCVEDQMKSPGTVYIFGRVFLKAVKRYVSCCTIVKNIKKTCYLLISPDATYEEAMLEFTNVTAKQHKFRNFTCQKVTKKYAFSSDINVPLEADYVQIDYPANQSSLPTNLKGETFKAVFNMNQSPMEKLILDLRLRGPCWLRLMDPVKPGVNITWTKIELILDSPDKLLVETEKLDVPYFCAFSLSLLTFSNPINHNNEILAIAGMVNTTFKLEDCLKRNNKASGHFCIMTKPHQNHKQIRLPYDYQKGLAKYTKTRFQLVETERDLLEAFMKRFMDLDPDIVVGHNLLNFDYETLVMRMRFLKMNTWSKLGRLKRSELAQTKATFRSMFSGRVMCDIKTSAMELIKSRSYDLTELSSQLLQKTRIDYNHDAIIEAYKNSDSLVQMIHATWEDTDSIFSILVELNIIPLAFKITHITGNILSRTLAAGRSERNEYLLLHAYHEANFICPEKLRFKNKEVGNRKAAYAGGLVLEPKTGYHNNFILLMDFNSLYPSIIQEFNICFSTVRAPDASQDDAIIPDCPNEGVATGILPAQLKNLVDRRRAVKKLMADGKSSDQKLLLDIEQKALKLTANSIYGCLGFEYSRFYAKHLAALVTFKGRQILLNTKCMVEQLGFNVIYGDTDSLMIDTKLSNYDDVISRGNEIKNQINRKFKLLEIDIDGVYRPLLLLKKKNYAGAIIKKQSDGSFSKEIETKGLDTVRRDRAVIAKEAGERVLNMILNCDKDVDQIVEEIHAYLRQLGTMVTSNELAVEKFLISKQLNKNPEQYQETKGVGHVSLALRHNNDSKRARKMKAGDTVEYVICLDGTKETANQRAYTIQELNESEGKLQIDHEYYLCQQIHPVMVRICDQLPITNAYVLAEMLGVEKSNLLHIKQSAEVSGAKRDQLLSRGAARFHCCKPLEIDCPNCSTPDVIVERSRKNAKTRELEFSLTNCLQCNFRYANRSQHIVVQIIQLIRKLTTDLYNTRLVCDNVECDYSTRNMFLPTSSNGGEEHRFLCEKCDGTLSPEWDDRKMDLQLNYLRHLFHIEPVHLSPEESKLEVLDDVVKMYRQCLDQVDYALKCSFINNIYMPQIFAMLCSQTSLQAIEAKC